MEQGKKAVFVYEFSETRKRANETFYTLTGFSDKGKHVIKELFFKTPLLVVASDKWIPENIYTQIVGKVLDHISLPITIFVVVRAGKGAAVARRLTKGVEMANAVKPKEGDNSCELIVVKNRENPVQITENYSIGQFSKGSIDEPKRKIFRNPFPN